jgi:4-amino-4-deoxy-L-arabinose transferase-like glycosyltransferase
VLQSRVGAAGSAPGGGAGRHLDLAPAWEVGLLALVLAVALGLRLYDLGGVPPGYTHDEAAHAHDAVAILEGARPIYQRVGYGREPLYDYVSAGLMWLTGLGSDALRLASVLSGLAALAVSYLWVRTAFGSATALVSASLQAVSFWGVATSRQALRSSLLPAFFAGCVYCYWRATERLPSGTGGRRDSRPRPEWLLASTVLLGLSLYTYLPARLAWIVFPADLLYLAIAHPGSFRRVWRSTLAFLLLGLVIGAPLFYHLAANPGVDQRLGDLWPTLGAGTGLLSLIRTALAGLGGFVVPGGGDDFLAYNIPGRPCLDPATGLLALGGLLLCVRRWRERPYVFSLAWFFVGISPSVLTGAAAATTRSIVALPVIHVFPALAGVSAAAWVSAGGSRWAGRLVWAGLAALLAVTAAATAYDYFVVWGQSPDVAAAYRDSVVAMAAYLDDRFEGSTVCLSTAQPLRPHDPYVLEANLERRGLSLRWFFGGRALVLPATAAAEVLVPESAGLNAAFVGLPGLRFRERLVFREDGPAFFDIYELDSAEAVAALSEDLERAGIARAEGSDQEVSLPVLFGSEVALAGYRVTLQTTDEEVVQLLTVWSVVDPEPLAPVSPDDSGVELVVFAHLVGAGGRVLAQEDRLDAPAWAWQQGDTVAQIHTIGMPAGSTREPLRLSIGVYRGSDLGRLSLTADGDLVGDALMVPLAEQLAQ